MTDLKSVHLPQGEIRYREQGDGPPIVFVHGYLVNGRLWEGTAGQLGTDFRCISPDWPMGSHSVALEPEADLSPPGVARIIADFLAELDLSDVTIVGNDSGGAVSQILVTRHPERIGRLVLTNCDSHENFPPSPFGILPRIVKMPGMQTALSQPLRLRFARKVSYAPFARTKIADELLSDWVSPSLHDAAIRRDTRKFTIGLDKRYTLEAAELLGEFEKPVLLAWAPDDRFFPMTYPERLADAFPDARLEPIENAKTFVPLDQPRRLAEAIRAFMREGSPVQAG